MQKSMTLKGSPPLAIRTDLEKARMNSLPAQNQIQPGMVSGS